MLYLKFYKDYLDGKKPKGLYLVGDFGTGKSYIITNGTSGTVKAISTESNNNNRKTYFKIRSTRKKHMSWHKCCCFNR